MFKVQSSLRVYILPQVEEISGYLSILPWFTEFQQHVNGMLNYVVSCPDP